MKLTYPDPPRHKFNTEMDLDTGDLWDWLNDREMWLAPEVTYGWWLLDACSEQVKLPQGRVPS